MPRRKPDPIEEKKYVLGFPFDKEYERVGLLRKSHPEWQKNRLNGWGGKMEEEDGDDHTAAMIREFREESGLIVPWIYNGVVIGYRWRLFVFSASINLEELPKKNDVEEVSEIWSLENLRQLNYGNCINNLKYLIPMCLDTYLIFTLIDSWVEPKTSPR